MTRASVSAMISVFNGAAYLAAAIDSVLVQLEAGDELIVVDDGSTDATPDILAGYSERIAIITQANTGSAAALNRAIAAARGEYLGFNDADDLWEPGRLAAQRLALDTRPEIDVVGGMVQQFISPELPEDERDQLIVPDGVQAGITMACLLMRRGVLETTGPFDESLPMTAVYDWLGRLRAGGRDVVMLDNLVLRRRLHASNWSRLNRVQLQAESLRAMRGQILRRRGEGE